jgi:hypothetical protein
MTEADTLWDSVNLLPTKELDGSKILLQLSASEKRASCTRTTSNRHFGVPQKSDGEFGKLRADFCHVAAFSPD